MNGKDIFLGLKYVGEDLVEEAEYGTFPVKKNFRRSLLVAALIALMALLVGCAVMYVIRMDSLKIGETTQEQYIFATDGVSITGMETVAVDVFTLAGLEGSAAYKANAEWYFYREKLLESLNQMELSGTLPDGYWESGSYQQELSEKAAELAGKYGLNPEGKELEFRTVRNMCDALGVERFQTTGEPVSAAVKRGRCYDNGNFWLEIDFDFQDAQEYDVPATWGILRWNRTDCFSRDCILLEDTGEWREWNYTTASGSDVLILVSPSDWRGYIICDRGDALMSLQVEYRVDLGYNVDGKTWYEYLYMTDRQMELLADALDFSIQPERVTKEDAEAQPKAPSVSTQNGYTLTLKSVTTDGYVAHILVGVTAPEGMDIESLDIGTGGGLNEFSPMFGQAYGSAGFNDVPDGDGQANTKDLFMEANLYMEDGTKPFGAGSVWTLCIEDLWVDKFRDTERILTEGEWNFQIVFGGTNADYREIELLSDPIKAKGCIGWKPDGTDVFEELEITSIKLRSFSIELNSENKNADFLCFTGQFSYIVMKDGRRIEFTSSSFPEPIDLDQVESVILADGTKLNVSVR